MENIIFQVRSLYNTAHVEKSDCQKLIQLSSLTSDIVIKSYFEGAQMISTKYLLNPFQIIKLFNASRNELEELISANFGNPEMHYIRYSIQMNTPSFVGYNKSKSQDRELLHHFLMNSQDNELINHMLIYFKNTNDLLPLEREKFQIH